MPSVQATKMEGIMTFAADWCTPDEVVILRCVSASLFVVVNGGSKDILDDKSQADLGGNVSTSLAV